MRLLFFRIIRPLELYVSSQSSACPRSVVLSNSIISPLLILKDYAFLINLELDALEVLHSVNGIHPRGEIIMGLYRGAEVDDKDVSLFIC